MITTNVFPIEEIQAYRAGYRLYAVRGLGSESEEFHRNLGNLSQRLARELRAPVMPVLRDKPYLFIRDGANEPKASYQLVRATAVLDRQDQLLTLDFNQLTAETRPFALKCLQFALQGAFWNHRELWQPHSGGTFFERSRSPIGRTIGLHRGFVARVVDLGPDGFGVCIDARHKYVAMHPLPAFISRRQFKERYQGTHVIYHFGYQWYEVRVEELNDLSVTELMIARDGRNFSLLEYIQNQSEKPIPHELAHLAKDGSVLHYFDNASQKKAVPSALCYAAYSTSDAEVRKEHGRTLLAPEDRRHLCELFREKYLPVLKVDGKRYPVAQRALAVPARTLTVPDLLFRQGHVLSVRGTAQATTTTLNQYGSMRLELLRSKRAGFHSDSALGRQFFFVPESIWQSWGPDLFGALRWQVDELYPQEDGYEPEVIRYNDSKGPTWVDQGTAIIAAARASQCASGFAVVMLNDTRPRAERKEDELAAFVLQKLWKEFDIRAAVMHTETGRRSYNLVSDGGGQRRYAVRPEMKRRFEGYVRNVAINKVLLTNEKWPFVLAEDTHASLVLGVDLKAHHAGYTLVGQGGRYVDTQIHQTRFAEQIRTEEMAKHFFAIVRRYHEMTGDFASSLVIHRDGRLFEGELAGARQAFARLKAEGMIAPGAELTCVQIGKHSFTSLRFFSVAPPGGHGGGEITSNPMVGVVYRPTPDDGYLVATGAPFARQGTALPLHVHKREGPMLMDQILEDVFRLTNLTWSQPEGCTRFPITLKINDRRLIEDAGQFDQHELDLLEEEADA